MIETIDVLDVLAEVQLEAHSAIIFTYGIDLSFYDGLLRRKLRARGITNQVIFCDGRQYGRVLNAVSGGAARFLGRGYSLTPVFGTGSFHPKVYMLLGREYGLMLIGSGNVTMGGLLRNVELFGRFDYDGQKPPHAGFRQILDMARGLAAHAPSIVQLQIDRAIALSPWLKREASHEGGTVLVGGPGHRALLEQIRENLVGQPDSLLVVGSSFDRKLAGLRDIAKLVPEPVQCLIQPDNVNLDGKAVAALKDRVDWHCFRDPRPNPKDSQDGRAHAKLVVFGVGDHDCVVYGSANPSAPALLGGDAANVEVVTLIADVPRGETVANLDLQESLESPSIANELTSRSWESSDEDEDDLGYGCLLSGAFVSGRELSIALAHGQTPPDAADAVITDATGRAVLARAALVRQHEQLVAHLEAWPASGRLVHLEDGGSAAVVSNTVAVTFPEVAETRGTSGLGSRTEAALAAMRDGRLLGTILFELLWRFRDFEVVFGRGGGARKKEDNGSDEDEAADEPHAEKDASAFYTDQVPGQAEMGILADRTDLDLLATFVAPQDLIVEPAPVLDDDALEEEGERREIDRKKGKASGDEKPQQSLAGTQGALERAVRRLERRLRMTAEALEAALRHRQAILTLPVAGIARQLWMLHLGAFLAGRLAPSSDGDDVICLNPTVFADHVLRVCRVLVGGKKGGLLHLLTEESWTGIDGESMQRGVAFAQTCAIWAAAHVARYWEKADPELVADGVWDAAPEFVAARFLNATRRWCPLPDTQDLERRLPAAAAELPGDRFTIWAGRVARLAEMIENVETGKGKALSTVVDGRCPAGIWVFHPSLGVTVLARVIAAGSASTKYEMVDLSACDPCTRVFVSPPRQVLLNTTPAITWRTPGWR